MNLFALIWIARIGGSIIWAEGMANVIYWRYANQPIIFQYGRTMRAIIGIILVMLSL